ncbi:TetR family transcriptional regulator, partial [Frankia sp. CpI1-P]|uniref:TetR family transcriptional regulator n=1 Tax=Frankia sp. CpI1-P TaxID=1502734 RepID=UPI002100A858
MRLADERGLAGLTMRRLAAELGVEAMSLYNHVANKRDLLDGIAARVYESIPLPDPALAWDERLRL